MPVIPARFETIIAPWSPAHPRHDHQLIFPLDDERLLFVWSEYYASAPSQVFRSQYDVATGTGDAASCRLSGKISTDRGRTWSDTFTIQENVWGLNVKHPNLLRLVNGEILFTFTAWETESDTRNVYMKKSADNAETWGPVEQIGETGWYCTNNDHIVRLSSGRILLPSHGGPAFAYQGRDSKLHSFVFISDDEAATWRLSADTMTVDGRGAHEPSIVELRDGRLLCFMRTTQRQIYKSYSEDGGDHWSTPEPTGLPAPDSPPLIKRVPGSDAVLLLWNHVPSDRNEPRTPLTAAVSHDEGDTWGGIRDIDDRASGHAAYASVTFVGDEVLVAYYSRGGDWARDAEVILRIYETAELIG